MDKNAPLDPKDVVSYLANLLSRITKGERYLSKHPDDMNAKRLLDELQYRSVWIKRFLDHYENLFVKGNFGYEVYLPSPLARFVNIIAAMLGSGTAAAPLSYFYLISRRLREVEEKIAFFDAGDWTMSPEELISTVADFAAEALRAWLEYRRWLTKIK